MSLMQAVRTIKEKRDSRSKGSNGVNLQLVVCCLMVKIEALQMSLFLQALL